VKASITEPRLDPVPTLAEYFEKSISNTSKHRERERHEQHGDANVEPRRGVDRAKRLCRQDHDQPQHAVDDGHGGAVDAAEHEAART
jgi:hypothetical protein